MPAPLLEVACEGPDEAAAAAAAGADRVELCARLDLDGLTPPVAWVRDTRARLRIPFVTMLRLREGGFQYDPDELGRMRSFAPELLAAGSDGLVVGPLRADGTVDEAATRAFVALAAGRDVVFHRAFDATPDPFAALDVLVGCGVTRILTSGGAPTALEGVPRLRALMDRAAGRIGIVVCGKVRAGNMDEVVRRTGATEVHRRFAADLV